jgi:hypothetical protein
VPASPAFALRASAFAKATADKTAGRLLRIHVECFNPALRHSERLGCRPERYVNSARAKARLSELVEKAASGEEIVIARDHKPVARLRPDRRGKLRVPGSLDRSFRNN